MFPVPGSCSIHHLEGMCHLTARSSDHSITTYHSILMYWPAFEFTYRLDVRALLPHVVALETYQQAALTSVLPPQWREQSLDSGSITPEDSQIKNPRRAQAWVKQRFCSGALPLSMTDILTMHRILSEESPVEYKTPGTLRSDPVQVGRPEVGGFHMGAPPAQLARLMEQYIAFINSPESFRQHPVIHALLAHFFFVTIHPFGDGNGRTSRLVSTAILLQHGYKVHGGFYALSDYFYHNGGISYHTLLHRCWQHGAPFDLTAFIAFGIEGFVMELRSMSSFLRMKVNRVIDRDDGEL